MLATGYKVLFLEKKLLLVPFNSKMETPKILNQYLSHIYMGPAPPLIQT